ncbi:carbon-nitrogen hydrolase family protein [Brucella tritici]|uniref:Carbon-nitrogen hydrolase family protein n=1 Tax=Brucella tritici TaxID=94626 RepID=A0A7X6FTH1_9HYPH|nr:carbon-nitrogen hydrolase family protein [Brucella tritici]KAB2667498.1 carbon-nitrogen hydrolase family protein [Brucella tritici]NKW10780.1 carbon-nitrogen hydrolase family protein [Brucella tritici]
MRVTAVQTLMGLSPDATVPAAEAAMVTAMQAEDRPDFLILPEYFSYYGPDQKRSVELAQPLREAPAFRMAQAFAKRHDVAVQAGTILAKVPGDERVANVSVVFDRQGEVIAEYRKMHLFDMGDLGSGAFRESDYIKPGDEIVTWELDGITFGTAICFDVRFPELFRALRLKDAEIITLPAAYTVVTGEAHWELLARARAAETQCHFIACGLGGAVVVDGQEKRCYGHSVIVDAWGQVVARAGQGADIITASLDMEKLHSIRNNMPVMKQRRLMSDVIPGF